MPGSRRKTRYKLKKDIKERGMSPITRAIQKFEIGQKVHITIDPSIHRGAPHPSFHGKTAEVTGRRGRAYLVEVMDGNRLKELIIRPSHLKPQR
ncbi:MAG: 50S ribosomal protein L21e [Methanocellales archaeon]|nr:50S ribosomal protein L21e [Methanocellales archaeon]MDD3291408.1 50S ribosomal protein L21e [Methanocellales archaeon]MDD5234702.1 50S ribosomal protein L21e [Methanocellales archaeon]MDD5484947.1 50S ribosomal protein L21e [Methanocellales archaeon]